jgi:hypothetical protein
MPDEPESPLDLAVRLSHLLTEKGDVPPTDDIAIFVFRNNAAIGFMQTAYIAQMSDETLRRRIHVWLQGEQVVVH